MLLVVAGACSLYSLGLDGRVRDAAPPELFARAMTLNSAGLMTLQGLGFVLAGALAQVFGPADAIAIAGCCGIAATVVLMGRELRPARSPRPATEVRASPLGQLNVTSGPFMLLAPATHALRARGASRVQPSRRNAPFVTTASVFPSQK